MEKEKVFSKEFIKTFAAAAKNGKIEIIQRTGTVADTLPLIAPIEKIPLSVEEGRIDSVYQFLIKRIDLFEKTKSHIVVDYDQKSIKFIGNDQKFNDDYETVIKGIIKETKDFSNIPFDEEFDAKELGRELRKRKHLFPNKDLFKKVFQELSSFKAKVNKEIENSDDNKGSKSFIIKENVIHSLTTEFTLKFEVLKGGEPIEFDVEIDIDASTLKCSLYAPEIESIIEEKTKEMIDSELNKIVSLTFTDESKLPSNEILMKDWCFIQYK